MRTLVVCWLIVFCFSAAVFGQSGRRVAPTPKPLPPSSEAAEQPAYSESKPLRERPTVAYPTRRSQPPNPSQPRSSNDSEVVAVEDSDDVLRIETNLITIPVSVFDRNGLYIPNLGKDDFVIFEDGKEQEIAYFGTSEQPFTVVLLLDTSPSTEYKIEEIQQAAIAFVDQLKPQDQVMVIEFDQNVHVLTEPTSDRQRIYKAIKRADFGGGTSLYDAVDFSLRRRLNKVDGRKAIVLFTDGVDTTSSKANYDSTLNHAEEADTIIFPIYYNTFFDTRRGGGVMTSPFPFPSPRGVYGRGTTAREYAVGRKYLEELAAVTGGRIFRADSGDVGLTRAFEGIAEELRRQYNIGYYPDDAGRPGQRKQIKVRVKRPNLVIRARDSYIVGAQEATSSTR